MKRFGGGGERAIYQKMLVFLFSLRHSSKTFLCLRRIERDIILNVQDVHIKYRYSGQVLMKLDFLDKFWKNSQISQNFLEVEESVFRPDNGCNTHSGMK